MTQSKQDMAEASRPADEELLQVMFEEYADLFSRDVVLTSEVTAYVHKHSVARPSSTRIGKILAKAPFFGIALKFRVGEKFFRGVIIRNHDKWRSVSGRELIEHILGGDDAIDIMS